MVLRFGSRLLDPSKPPTDAEVLAVAEPAAEGLPPWVFHWSIRLLGAVFEFVDRRLPGPQPPKPPPSEKAPEPGPTFA
jgi:hypothetical protein